jgi:outer membrane receptor protein involved in Fe transport
MTMLIPELLLLLLAADPSPSAPAAAEEIPRVEQTIVVTAARTEQLASESPASIVVVHRHQLDTAAAQTLDDVLRQVPGFTLFRRSGSRFAHPTTQGVSLRGTGASGAGRALVMYDGVPLNDPFGGWVYWAMVPRIAIGRVEIVRGGGSDLYGSNALGGVVHLFPREHGDAPRLTLNTSYGSARTADASLFTSTGLGPWHLSLAGELFSTGGYVQVRERGAVDTPVRSRHMSLQGGATRQTPETTLSLRIASYDEDRDNGTPLQVNDTSIRQLVLSGEGLLGARDALGFRLYGSKQTMRSDFSAIAPDRDTERLTRSQTIPADSWGTALQWTQSRGRHQLVAGGDLRDVRATSDEVIFAGPRAIPSVTSGHQRLTGLFVQDLVSLGDRATATAALRFDRWRNFDAERVEGDQREQFADRRDHAVSPRLGVTYRATAGVWLAASAYRGFRAPTLNELYRGFRVGDVVTLSNEDLSAERVTGADVGVHLHRQNLMFQVRLFRMIVDDAIANVTLSATPSLITRQRQNLGTTRSRGVELEARLRPTPAGEMILGYLLADATVSAFAPEPEMEGRWVPQVPRHQLSAGGSWSGDRTTIGLQTRWSSTQFDDDRNQLRLSSYFLADLFASYAIRREIEMFVAAENLFDQEYEIGRTPVSTIGPPRSLRLGIRAAWSP